jgi:photosystem II stability/assembly factor-like uncharacterized protein
VILAAATALSTLLSALGQNYRPFPTAGGGAIMHVAASPHDPNLVLAAGDVSGVFRSTDGGQTWNPAWGGLKNHYDFSVADVLFDPVNPNVAWAASGKTWDQSPGNWTHRGNLWRSADAGQTWQSMPANLGFVGQFRTDMRQYGQIIWRDPGTTDRLLVGTADQGLLQSNDGGQNWNTIIAPTNIGVITHVSADPTRPGYLYVGARNSDLARPYGLWRSVNNGQSFTQILSGTSIESVSVSPSGAVLAAGQALRLSNNGGITWSDYSQGLTAGNFAYFTAAADPFAANRFVMASYPTDPFATPKVFTRQDSLATGWKAVENSDPSFYTTYGSDGWHSYRHMFGASPSGVSFHPTQPGHVFMYDWYTVNRSTDSGRHWEAKSGGLLLTVPSSVAWDQLHPGELYLAFTDVGMYKASAGATLTAQSILSENGLIDPAVYQFRSGNSVITIAENHSRDYANSFSYIWRKVNDGDWQQVWQDSTVGVPGGTAIYLATNEQTATSLMLTNSGRLLRSTNAGASWSAYTDATLSQVAVQEITYLAFEDGQWMLQTSAGKTYRTTTLGQWSQNTYWPKRPVGDPTNSSRLFGISANTLVRSTNDGQAWLPVLSGVNQMAIADDGTLYGIWSDKDSGTITVKRSMNGGNSWQTIETPPGYGGEWTFLVPDPANGRRFAWGGHGVGVWLGEVPVFSRWSLNGSGNWSSASNWSDGVPNGIGAEATLSSVITAPRTITLDTPVTVGTLHFDSASSYTLGGTHTLTMRGGSNAVIDVRLGSHQIVTALNLPVDLTINVAPGTVLSISSELSCAAGISLLKTGGGIVETKRVRADRFAVSDGRVNIMSNGSDSGVSRVSSLSLSPEAVLDLRDNSLVIDYDGVSPLPVIQERIVSGFDGGQWAGAGLSTSLASTTLGLGYGEASTLGISQFSGQIVDSTSVLVRFTLYGDANLDAEVTSVDFNVMQSGFGAPRSLWTSGDFTYDGKVTTLDFNLLAGNFGASVPSGALLGSLIPEPGVSISLLLLSLPLSGRPGRYR